MLIPLHYPNTKKYRNIDEKNVFVETNKISYLHRKHDGNMWYTEIFFGEGDSIIVVETPEEIGKIMINLSVAQKLFEKG